MEGNEGLDTSFLQRGSELKLLEVIRGSFDNMADVMLK